MLAGSLKGLQGVSIVSSPQPLDEDFRALLDQTDSVAVEPDLVEDSVLQVHQIPSLGCSGFSHFLDGTQKVWRRIYVGHLPVLLAHTSAAIIERREREMLPPGRDWWSGSIEAFMQEHEILEAALLERGITPVIVPPRKESSAVGYMTDLTRRVTDRREEHEVMLGTGFSGDHLLVDGGIGRILAGADLSNVAGLVKTHSKQYFIDSSVVCGLRDGERTSVFRRPGDMRQGAEAYSFYMRLHNADGQSPMFGIIRIEVPALPEALDSVDEVAAWIMHERYPMSLPDARHDRLLYPIHLVEEHLRSRVPTEAAIIGMLR